MSNYDKMQILNITQNTKIFLSIAFTLITYNNVVLQIKRFIQPLLHHLLISKYMLIIINTQKSVIYSSMIYSTVARVPKIRFIFYQHNYQ